MNRCRFIKELDSYWDNQLSGRKKLALEEHLKQCAVCAEELGKLKTLSEKLRTWPAPILESTFDSSVKNKIVALELEGGRVKMKNRTLRILIPSGAVAGILIVSLLSFQMYMKGAMSGRLRSGFDSFDLQSASESDYRESAYDSPSSDRRNRGVQIKMRKAGYDKASKVQQKKETEPLTSDSISNIRREIKKDSFLGELPLGGLSSDSILTRKESTSFQGEDSRVIVIQPTLPATGIGDMIIRTAELTLEVENGQETYRKIAALCRELGGYQAESRFSKNDQGREAGTVTLRIPKDKFLNALDKLSELGKVKANDTHSQDVSQDHANLKAELNAAMVVYNKMLEALQKRQTNIPEAIRLESELTPVLKKIENLKNEIEKLNNLTSFTTITVNFYEAEVSAKVLEETKKLVKENMLAAKINAVRYFATHLPLVGLVAGFTIAAFVFVVVLSILITRLKKRG